MSDRDLEVKIEVDAGSSQQNIEKGITAPLAGAEVAGEKAAETITVAVQQIEGATAGAVQSTQQLTEAEGALASTSDEVATAVAAESQAAEHLAEATTSATAATETATDATQALADTATTAAGSEENLGAAAKKAADDLAAEAAEIAKATAGIRTFADEADKVANKLKAVSQGAIGPQLNKEWEEVTPRIRAVQSAIDTLNAASKNGAVAPKTAIKDLGIQYALLREQIISTYGSLENPAAANAIATYQELGVELEATIEKQARLAEKAREVGEAFDRQSGKLGSVDKAIESIGGSYGKLILQMGIYAGLAGVAIGVAEKIANALDDDAKAVDGYKEATASMASEVKHAFYEMGGSVFNVLGKLGEGEREETRATFELEHALENLAVRIVSTKEIAAGLRAEQAAGLPILERLKSADNELKLAADFYGQSLQRGAIGQKEWAAAVAESGGTLEGLIAAIGRQNVALAAHDKALKRIKDAEEEAIREREKHIEVIKHEIDALNGEVDQVKRWAELAGTEVEKRQRLMDLILRQAKLIHELDYAHHGITKSITDELKVITDLLPFGERYSVQLAAHATLLHDLITKTDGLTTAERLRLEQAAEALSKFDDLVGKQKALRDELNKELDELTVLKNASRDELDARVKKIHELENEITTTNALAVAQKASEAIQKVQAATAEKAADAIIKVTRASGEAVEAGTKLAGGFDELKEKIGGVRDTAETLATAGEKTGKALRLVDEAAHGATKSVTDLSTKTIAANTSIENIGDTSGKVAVKVSGAAEKADTLAAAGEKTGTAMKGAGEAAEGAGRSIGDLATKAIAAHTTITMVGEKAEIAAGQTKKATDETGHLATVNDDAATAESKHSKQLVELSGELGKVAETIKSDLLVQLRNANTDLDTFKRTLNESKDAAIAMSAALGTAATNARALANMGDAAPTNVVDSGGVEHTAGG